MTILSIPNMVNHIGINEAREICLYRNWMTVNGRRKRAFKIKKKTDFEILGADNNDGNSLW